MNQLTFITGGARSGKSTYAETRAAEFGDAVLYCATAEALDAEMRERIRRHRERRPAAWRTVEAPRQTAAQIAAALVEAKVDCVLLDCLAVLTSNVLLSMEEETTEAEAFERLHKEELAPLKTVIEKHPEIRWLVVSNEVGMGVVPAYPLGRLYRDLLGRANQWMAAQAGEVIFMVAGIPMFVKSIPGRRSQI